MGFNEKVHAYIAAKYYCYLKEAFGDRGVRAFIHATQYYAEQRGRRMAQRAIRDGAELTPANYARYGEWVNTQEIIDEGCNNKIAHNFVETDDVLNITQCPWYTQFKEMGLNTTAGNEYCKHLDNSIVRGFNPYLTYDVDQTLQTAAYCIHTMRNVDYDANSNLSKDTKNMRNFEYHCAHSFWAYNEVTAAIFQNAGEEINAKVLKDFEKEYGAEMANALLKYKYTNFNVCD